MISDGCTVECLACGRLIRFPERPQRHHKFSNTVANNKYYGPGNEYDGEDWINCELNIQYPVCAGCNGSHAGSGLVIWSEVEFCRVIGIEPRSKAFRFKVFA